MIRVRGGYSTCRLGALKGARRSPREVVSNLPPHLHMSVEFAEWLLRHVERVTIQSESDARDTYIGCKRHHQILFTPRDSPSSGL